MYTPFTGTIPDFDPRTEGFTSDRARETHERIQERARRETERLTSHAMALDPKFQLHSAQSVQLASLRYEIYKFLWRDIRKSFDGLKPEDVTKIADAHITPIDHMIAFYQQELLERARRETWGFFRYHIWKRLVS